MSKSPKLPSPPPRILTDDAVSIACVPVGCNEYLHQNKIYKTVYY